jgi:hypothetical protein
MIKNKTTGLGVAACATGFLCLAANAAFAGEITGNGKILKNDDGSLNGNSACAFSGRQDNYEEDEGLFRSMITQNWGQLFKELKAIFPHPGSACNPTTGGEEP